MSRSSVVAVTVLGLLIPASSRATFHDSRISEVMVGAGGNPSIQYVEIDMLFGSQNFVGNTRLTAFSCDGTAQTVLLVVPGDLSNQGAGVKWIAASPDDATFFAASGLHADFYFSPGIDPSCGMVCFGAPGIIAPDPSMWDPSDPNNYVDCVAYGGYTGPTKTSTHDGTPRSGTPSKLPPGDGNNSLTRTGDSANNLADFELTCPSPTNNAGQAGSFGACPPVGPPDPAAVRCEDAAAKNLDKLAGCITKCQIKQVTFGLSGKTFDETQCEEGSGTPVSCRAAYDKASTALVARGTCPACLAPAVQDSLADAIINFVEQHNGEIYCSGTNTLGDDDPGTVPPDKPTAKCETAVAKSLSKFWDCTTMCQIKQADFSVRGAFFDVAACQDGTAKPVSCRAAYDNRAAVLERAGSSSTCPACLDATVQGTLADQLQSFLSNMQGDVYCAGTPRLQGR